MRERRFNDIINNVIKERQKASIMIRSIFTYDESHQKKILVSSNDKEKKKRKGKGKLLLLLLFNNTSESNQSNMLTARLQYVRGILRL